MSLFEIQKKLYEKDGPENQPARKSDRYDPTLPQGPSAEKEGVSSKDLWAQKQTGLGQTGRSILRKSALISGVLVFLILAVALGLRFKDFLFSSSKVYVSLSGPAQIMSGKSALYEINYRNDSRTDLEDVFLKIAYPDNFKPAAMDNFQEESVTSGIFSLGKLAKKSQGKLVFQGRAYTPKGALIYLKADLDYKPSNFSSRFSAKSQLGVNVSAASIALELQAPQNVSSGDAVDLLLNYKNEGEEPLSDLRVRFEYPEGFVFFQGNPKVSEGDNIWYLGTLSGGQSGKVVVSGKISGDQGLAKVTRVSIGSIQKGQFISLNDESAETRIVSSPLSISQTVNGLEKLNANPGDSLSFKISYRNDGEIGLRDVIITEKISSPVLDYTTLNLPGGSFDHENKIITWKASDFSELKNLGPRQGGTISFDIRVKDMLPVESGNDRNFLISSLAKIDSPDVPTPISMNKVISGNQIDIKVNSKIILDVRGFYADLDIPNSGPIPPKVNEETTYTLRWRVSNVSNDLGDTRVSVTLPTGVKMTGKTHPSAARISYNERDNSVVWEIGKMEAGTGILNPPLEAAFQVSIKPSPELAGKEVKLLGDSTIFAKDLFTQELLEKKSAGKTTNLIEDSSIKEGSRVVN